MQSTASIQEHPSIERRSHRDTVAPTADDLVEQARRLLCTQLPGSTELIDHTAFLITYGFGPELADLACVIRPCGPYIELGFFNGRGLQDSSGLLQPWTTNHRVLRVGTPEDLQQPALLNLLAQVRARHREPRNP